MAKTERTVIFEQTPIPRAVLTLAIPMVAASLVTVLYSLADTWFVGLLSDPIETAAVTLAAPVLLAFNAVNNLFGVGTGSMMSRALGRKDFDTVKRASSFGFYCAAFSGLLFSLLVSIFMPGLLRLLGADADNRAATQEYLFWTVCCGAIPSILNVVLGNLVRSEGESLHASIGTMSGCFLNILLDPVFILPWGLDLGAAGAGLATFLSNLAACLYFFVLLRKRRGKTFVSLSFRLFGFRRAIVLGIFAVGVPAAIQNLLNVTGMTVLNNFTAAFGSDAVSAMGIAQKVHLVPLYVTMGISQGVMPLVGYNYASGNSGRMKRAILFTGTVMILFQITVTVGIFLAAGPLVALFMKNETIVAYGGPLLRGMCLCLPLMCMDFLAVGVFQACGMGRKALIFAILRKIVLEIPLLVLLNRLWPLYGLAYAQPIAELVLAAAAVFSLRRIFRSLPKSEEESV